MSALEIWLSLNGAGHTNKSVTLSCVGKGRRATLSPFEHRPITGCNGFKPQEAPTKWLDNFNPKEILEREDIQREDVKPNNSGNHFPGNHCAITTPAPTNANEAPKPCIIVANDKTYIFGETDIIKVHTVNVRVLSEIT